LGEFWGWEQLASISSAIAQGEAAKPIALPNLLMDRLILAFIIANDKRKR
jgi:hypothetical protein